MCLEKKHKFPKLTLFPKKVYKILHRRNTNVWITPFQEVRVTPGEYIQATKSLFHGITADSIKAEGVHVYNDKLVARMHASADSRDVVFEAIIPPFTFYWADMGMR